MSGSIVAPLLQGTWGAAPLTACSHVRMSMHKHPGLRPHYTLLGHLVPIYLPHFTLHSAWAFATRLLLPQAHGGSSSTPSH
mmetsp:Transcript_9494/g.20234  ORF Transcript_9494/g.20234 Transcript_9494/m.20234 type:complete len:81 (-) Transcript_9494:416-658(-)